MFVEILSLCPSPRAWVNTHGHSGGRQAKEQEMQTEHESSAHQTILNHSNSAMWEEWKGAF